MSYCPSHLLFVVRHTFAADAVKAYLAVHQPDWRVSTALSIPQVMAIADASPDLSLALLDGQLPDMRGLAGLRLVRQRHPELPLAVLSDDDSPRAVRLALEAGARGFIPKSLGAAAVVAAVRLMLAGERYIPAEPVRGPAAAPEAHTVGLSPREREVLDAILLGRSNKEIAAAMGVSPATVALHLTNVYRKMKVSGRAQALRRAFELDLPPDRRRT